MKMLKNIMKVVLLILATATFAQTQKIQNLQITGGSPGVGKVLTSDAVGNATWQYPTATPSLSSTNGTGVVTSFGAPSCNTNSINGTMTIGVPVNAVTMSIYANVTTGGTYSITTGATNGVTFTGSGTFAGTGCQLITLTATGIPVAAGSNTWTTNTTPAAIVITTVLSSNDVTSSTGKVWMDRNLGASRIAQSVTDHLAYGQLYQWGRGNDGHADIIWTSATTGIQVNGTTTTLSTTDNPAYDFFIIGSDNWRATQNDNLWQGASGINNPCPAGYRLPTITELAAEVTAYGITNSATAFASPLKFTVPGNRSNATGTLSNVGSVGCYWSSSLSGTNASILTFFAGGTTTSNYARAVGFTVRCLKN